MPSKWRATLARAGAVVFLIAAATYPAKAVEYLLNGGFEDGVLHLSEHWTQTGDVSGSGVTSGNSTNITGAQAGNFYYIGGSFNVGHLVQSFDDTAGSKLLFTGYWAGNDRGGPSMLGASFNGVSLFSIGGPDGVPNTNDTWIFFSFVVTATGHDNISLDYYDWPSHVYFDSISVTDAPAAPPSTTPLPSALLLLSSGVGAGAMLLRRRKRAA